MLGLVGCRKRNPAGVYLLSRINVLLREGERQKNALKLWTAWIMRRVKILGELALEALIITIVVCF